MPEIAVVIPTHNRAAMLPRAVHCALGQLDVDHEVVVVDDGSADGTGRFLDGIDDPRLTVVRHQRARGVSEARNAGIRHTTATWIAFLDDDDVWSPHKLARQLAAVDETQRRWVYAGMVTVDPRLHVVHGSPPPRAHELRDALPRRNLFPSGPSNVVVTRAALEQVGGFDPTLSYNADWDLWLRLLPSHGEPALADAPLLAHVRHEGNMSFRTHIRELAVIADRHAALRSEPTLDLGHTWRWMASSHLEAGQVPQALKAAGVAFRHDPAGTLRQLLALLRNRTASRRTAFRRFPSPNWLEAASSWLGPLRAWDHGRLAAR